MKQLEHAIFIVSSYFEKIIRYKVTSDIISQVNILLLLNLIRINFFDFWRCMKHEFGIIPWNSNAPDVQSSNDEGQIYDSPILRPFLFPSVIVRHFHKAVYSLGKWTRRYTDRQNGHTGIQTVKMNEPVKIKSSDRRPEINKRFEDTIANTFNAVLRFVERSRLSARGCLWRGQFNWNR